MLSTRGVETMKKAINKAIILFLLFVVLPVCISADPFRFQIAHAINVSSSYSLVFWKFRTAEAIPNNAVSYSSGGDYGLATLGITYNSMVRIPKLEIEVSDLTLNGDDSKFLDFTLQVYKANDPTSPFSFTQTSPHGAGSATLFTNKTFTKYDTTHTWNNDEIADFRIIIDDSTAVAGTYSGYLKFIVTT